MHWALAVFESLLHGAKPCGIGDGPITYGVTDARSAPPQSPSEVGPRRRGAREKDSAPADGADRRGDAFLPGVAGCFRPLPTARYESFRGGLADGYDTPGTSQACKTQSPGPSENGGHRVFAREYDHVVRPQAFQGRVEPAPRARRRDPDERARENHALILPGLSLVRNLAVASPAAAGRQERAGRGRPSPGRSGTRPGRRPSRRASVAGNSRSRANTGRDSR